MEQLHKLIEATEKVLDVNNGIKASLETRIASVDGEIRSELSTLKASIEKSSSDVADMNTRLHQLDKELGKGDKVYRSIVDAGSNDVTREARLEVANIVADGIRGARKLPPKYSSYSRQQTEYDQTSTTGDEGGLLVPEQYVPTIVRIQEKYGIARQLFKVMKMNSNKMRIPTNTTLPTVTWDTQLAERELTSPSQSGVLFGRPELEAHKLIAIDTMSIEVLDDAIPFIQDFVIDMFALAMAKEEDQTAFMAVGSDSGEPFSDGGIMNLSGVTNVVGSANTFAGCLKDTAAEDGGYTKLLETMDAADESTSDTGIWVVSNSIMNNIRNVRDTTGQPLWAQMAGGPPNTLFGRPVVRSRVFPKVSDASQAEKPFILFGDFSTAIMGDRQQMRIDVSEHAAFKEYGMVLRIAERVAFKVLLKAPFAKLNTSA